MKGKEEARDRDQEILNRLARIEHRVDSMDQTSAFAMRADSGKHLSEIQKIFKNSKRRAQIYLAANGDRGVEEIAAHLSMKRQNVGPDLKLLSLEGLLELAGVDGHKDIWAKKQIDRTLRITKHLCDEHNLAADGRSLPAGRVKKLQKR